MHEILKDKKVIFFDVGYTIDMPASGNWRLTNKFYEILGEKIRALPKEKIDEALKMGNNYLNSKILVLTEKEECERFYNYYRIVIEKLQINVEEKIIREIADDHTYNMDNYIIYPDTKEVIETLSHTHRLGIISNTWPSIYNQLRAIDVLQFFSFATYSFSLGVFKPDKRIYIDALGKCGCDASATVFIDDIPRNLEEAAKLGITPILIAANPISDVETPFHKIKSLSELL